MARPKKNTPEKKTANESVISIILGALIVLVVGIIVYNYFSRINKKEESQNGQIPTEEGLLTSTPEITKSANPTELSPTLEIPTSSPTAIPTLKATTAPTVVLTYTPAPTKITANTKPATGEIKNLPVKYTVQQGDDLWNIALKYYKSGYNWVDIAKANNLADPNFIETGMTLTLPKAKEIIPGTLLPEAASNAGPTAITSSSYTVVKGDDLWNIAVRACGDGYKWVKIARDNNLLNPGLIHRGNILKINCK